MWQNKTCVGIDISGRDIKIVELAKSGGRYEVVQAARLEAGADGVAAALRRFMTETNTAAGQAVVSIPTNACSIKFASVPRSSKSDTARMARYEAESQIPLPLSELAWGYSAAKSSSTEELHGIMVSGTRRSLVDELLETLEPVRLPISAMTPASLAEAAALQGTLRRRDDSAIIMSIGGEWTDLTTVCEGQVIACRSVRTGLAELIRSVADEMGISQDEARQILVETRDAGELAKPGPVETCSAAQKWVQSLAMEIRRSVLSIGSEHKHAGIVLSAGEGSHVNGLAQALSGAAGIPVEVCNPWAGMSLSAVASHSAGYLPSVFSVATGLALSGFAHGNVINLMPTERDEEESKNRKQVGVVAGLGVAAVVLALVVLYGSSGVGAKASQLKELQMQTAQAREHAGVVQPNLSAAAGSMEKLVKDLKDTQGSPVKLLYQLSVGLPKNCWLTEFRYEAGKSLVVRGNALSDSAVADAVYMLSDGDTFKSVALEYSNEGKNTDSPTYDFQIKCQLPPDTVLPQLMKKGKPAKAEVAAQ
jgi:type IV pilus assembly protein PilM